MNRCATVFFCALLLSASGAMAQTDVSLRIRSLGASFSGILDDYLTDIFLNPARTAEFDGSMVYGGRLPSRDFTVQKPITSRFFQNSPIPIENSLVFYRVSPIVLSYIRSAPGRGAVSLSVETSVDRDDGFDEDRLPRFTFGGTDLDNILDQSASELDTQHYVVDFAGASGGHQTQLGFRLTARYQTDVEQRADVRTETSMRLTNPGETARAIFSSLSSSDYEKSDLRVELGMARKQGLLRDIVVGGSLGRELLTAAVRRLDSRDNDADGNGVPIIGSLPQLNREFVVHRSNRDYRGYGVSARIHLRHGGRVRSTFATAWSRSSGDGNADFQDVDEASGGVETRRNSRARYVYEGDTTDFRVQSSLGTSREITEDALVAGAVRASYSVVDFDEIGGGDASLSFGGRSSVLDTTFASPYAQRHAIRNQTFELVIPVAVEWSFHRNARLRIGINFLARHVDNDRRLDQQVDAVNVLNVFPQGGSGGLLQVFLRTDIEAVFNSGLEIHVRDRFMLDLMASVPTSSVDLTRFSFLSARYLF